MTLSTLSADFVADHQGISCRDIRLISIVRLFKTDKYRGRINKSFESEGNNGTSRLCLNRLITKYGVTLAHCRSQAFKQVSVLLGICHGGRVMEYIWPVLDRKMRS